MTVPTLPRNLAPRITPLGWALDDFEFLEEGLGRALFRSVAYGLFVRHDLPARQRRATTEVAFAAWAASAGLPVVAPDERVVSQPLVGDFGAVTFWPLLEPVPPAEVDLGWFGRTLRRLHDQRPLPAVAHWEPQSWVAAGVEALRSTPGIDTGLAAALDTVGERALSRAEAVAGRSVPVAIHGDAFPDNVARDGDRLLLTDFEKGSIGPAGYDLAPVRMLARRFGLEPAHADAVLAAHEPYPGIEAVDALTNVLEVVVIAGAIAPYAAHRIFAEELRRRLISLEQPGAGIQWTGHRDLLAHMRATNPMDKR